MTENSSSTPSELALERLIEGNKRFVNNKLHHPNRSEESREAAVLRQNPFAIILGCSDSRVSPEILFDQGIGDLFVIRVAGNVAGDIELNSVDFSALNLGSSLILVLGHENCGAVDAVLNRKTSGIETIARLIQPAIKNSMDLEEAVKANVRSVVKQLNNSPALSPLIKEGKLKVCGGYYILQSGEVQIIER